MCVIISVVNVVQSNFYELAPNTMICTITVSTVLTEILDVVPTLNF